MNKNKTVWVISGCDDDGIIWEPEVFSSYDNAREALVKYAREFKDYYSNVEIDDDELKYGELGRAYIDYVEIDGGNNIVPTNNEFRIPLISGTLIVSENPDPDYSGASILFETANGNTVDIALVECRKEDNWEKIHTFVYADVCNEDFTNKFTINVDNIDDFFKCMRGVNE